MGRPLSSELPAQDTSDRPELNVAREREIRSRSGLDRLPAELASLPAEIESQLRRTAHYRRAVLRTRTTPPEIRVVRSLAESQTDQDQARDREENANQEGVSDGLGLLLRLTNALQPRDSDHASTMDTESNVARINGPPVVDGIRMVSANSRPAPSRPARELETDSDDEEIAAKPESADQGKKGLKRLRADYQSGYSVVMGYDPRVFLRNPDRCGIKLSEEGKRWAVDFRKRINLSGDPPLNLREPPDTAVMDRIPPSEAPSQWRRVSRSPHTSLLAQPTFIYRPVTSSPVDDEDSPQDSQDSDMPDQENPQQNQDQDARSDRSEDAIAMERLEDEVRIEQEIYEEYGMAIPPYMSSTGAASVRDALERLTNDLTAHINTIDTNGREIDQILIRFASEEDLQVEVFRVLNGMNSTPPRYTGTASLVVETPNRE